MLDPMSREGVVSLLDRTAERWEEAGFGPHFQLCEYASPRRIGRVANGAATPARTPMARAQPVLAMVGAALALTLAVAVGAAWEIWSPASS